MEILADAERNAASITLADGRDIAIALGRGKLVGPPPVYVAMWVQSEWNSGRTLQELVDEIGVHRITIGTWAGTNGFWKVSNYSQWGLIFAALPSNAWP